MNLNSILVSIITILSVQMASAEMLNVQTKSPYNSYVMADERGKAEVSQALEDLAKDSSWSKEEAMALTSLASQDPEMSGDDVLEALDQDVINWFYGLQPENDNTVHPVVRLSTTPDVATCRSFTLCVVVDVSEQRIYAHQNGQPVVGVNDQPVSTARAGKITPRGLFDINEIGNVNSKSSKYKGAYMGFRMQFWGHYFIHATSKDHYAKLGGPASAGCVRTTLAVAKQLNGLMRQVGRPGIRVVVKD